MKERRKRNVPDAVLRAAHDILIIRVHREVHWSYTQIHDLGLVEMEWSNLFFSTEDRDRDSLRDDERLIRLQIRWCIM